MGRVRGVLVVLAVVAGVLAAGPAPASHPPFVPGAGAPDGGPELGPIPPASPVGHLRAWTGIPRDRAQGYAFSNHEVIVTDYPFDDYGADIDGSDGRTDNPTELYPMLHGANAHEGQAGDYRYPTGDAYVNNVADIVEVRVAADAEAWYLLVILNALVDPDVVAIEARLDDRSLVMHGNEGSIDGTPVEVVTDPTQNVFEARVPVELWAPDHEGYQNLFVASGLWDPDANAWHRPGGPALLPYYDLAYGLAGISYWNDDDQATAIATGNFEYNSFGVSYDSLSCVPDCGPVFIPRTGDRGLSARVFRSSQDAGEGVIPETLYGQNTSWTYKRYLSRYQPYSIYVPTSALDAGPRPLMILDHFLAGNYMSYPITSFPELGEWAERMNVIIAMPHARGEAGWYEGLAEKDVFEVWRDVAQHYPVDRERVYLAGMSMGGYSTWRLGSLYPDQFAATVNWSGPVTPYSISLNPLPVTYPYPNPPMCDRDAPGCGFSLTDLFGNRGNLPTFVVHGGADELVPSIGVETWMTSYDEFELPHRYVFYPTRRHETSYPGTTTHWLDEWLGSLPARVRVPVRVEYTLVRDLFQEGFNYDGAYWVSGMQLAHGEDVGRIWAWASTAERRDTATIDDRYGLDDLGPYRVRGRDVLPETPSSTRIRFEGEGVQRASIDTAALGWDPNRRAGGGAVPNSVVGGTLKPMQLELIGAFPDDVVVEGASFARSGSNIVLELPIGEFAVHISAV